MVMLQGSTYELAIKIRGVNGVVIDDGMVKRGSFSVGDVEKRYGEGGEVRFDKGRECWVIPLSEGETMGLQRSTKWQARFLLKNGKVVGTVPKSEYVYESINRVQLSGGGEDAGE